MGLNAHNFTVIDSFEGNTSYALGKEMFWIRTYMSNRSKFPEINGLNITDGGEGSLGAKRTIEQKKAQSIRTKGKKINRTFTEEDKQKLREHNSKYRHTDEAKKRIGEAAKGNTYCKGKKMHPNTQEALLKAVIGNKFNLGKKQSQQHKDRIREANTGKQRSKEFIEKQTENRIKTQGKPIIQYDKNSNIIKEFPAILYAARELGVFKSVIKDSLINNGFSRRLNSYFKYKIS